MRSVGTNIIVEIVVLGTLALAHFGKQAIGIENEHVNRSIQTPDTHTIPYIEKFGQQSVTATAKFRIL